jgi:hypothetical protein
MYKILIFLFAINFGLKSQTKSDSVSNQELQYINYVFASSDAEFQGFIRDFKTLQKGVFIFENGLNNALLSTFKYGVTKNIELNTGLIYAGSSDLLFGQTVGLKINQKIGENVLLGADLNTTFPKFKHSLSFGGQYQNKRLMVGASLFMKMGKHRSFGVTSMNSNNIFANFRLTKRKAISILQIFPNNPRLKIPPSYYDVYLEKTTNVFFQFLFKKSSLNLGVACSKSFIFGNFTDFQNQFMPSINFNRILK